MKAIVAALAFVIIIALLPSGISAQTIAQPSATQDGITVSLLKNTDHCDIDCQSVYDVCVDPEKTKSVPEDAAIIFKDSKGDQITEYGSKIRAATVTVTKSDTKDTSKAICKKITVAGTKGIFERIDNIPCFDKVCFPEFAWWNPSWFNGTRINIYQNNEGQARTNELIIYNFTGLALANADEIRIVDADCNDGGTDIARDIISTDNSTWAQVAFLANRSAFSNATYCIYFNNPSAPKPNYPSGFVSVGTATNGFDINVGSNYRFTTQQGLIRYFYGPADSFNIAYSTNPLSAIGDDNVKRFKIDTVPSSNVLQLKGSVIAIVAVSDGTRTVRYIFSPNSAFARINFEGFTPTAHDGIWFQNNKTLGGMEYRDSAGNLNYVIGPDQHNNAYGMWMQGLNTDPDMVGIIWDLNKEPVTDVHTYARFISDDPQTCGFASGWCDGGGNNMVNGIGNFSKGDIGLKMGIVTLNIANSTYYKEANPLQIEMGLQFHLSVLNFTFNIKDSFTGDDLQSVLLACMNSGAPSDNFSVTVNSPYIRLFTNLTVYGCNVSRIGYENFSFSINPAIYISATVYLDRIGGLTQSEKSKLDQIYFLQSVAALPEELIIQSQSCLDANTLSTSYNPVYCSNPSSCNDVLTACPFGCDPVTTQCRGNPIETGALFIGFIIFMASIIVIPILILTHHSKKHKRDAIIGFFTFFFMIVIYGITTVFVIPSIALFFGNDYYFTVILVGITIIIFPLVDLLLIINNIMKDRY